MFFCFSNAFALASVCLLFRTLYFFLQFTHLKIWGTMYYVYYTISCPACKAFFRWQEGETDRFPLLRQPFLFFILCFQSIIHQKDQFQDASESFFSLPFHPQNGSLPAGILAKQNSNKKGCYLSFLILYIAGACFIRFLCGVRWMPGLRLIQALLHLCQKIRQIFKPCFLCRTDIVETTAPFFFARIYADNEGLFLTFT